MAGVRINLIRKCDLLRQVFLWLEKDMSQLHGIETIELTSGTVAVTTIQTAIIGLVGTAPESSAGSAAAVTTGTPILDNVLNFTAKERGRAGNVIQVDAVAAVP
ncbi:phage tail protein, partial [Escherichia fergusonii]|nr:phage tail protein [Escherichia fergusonii]